MTKKGSAKRAVRGSKTGRPIMALLDLLGRRWTLRIIWELREQALTLLQARLDDLRQAGFVELDPAGGYGLTDSGKELFGTFMPLHHFAERWSKTRPAS
jgi:DNA-binding HxlR family transcriptional regulator